MKMKRLVCIALTLAVLSQLFGCSSTSDATTTTEMTQTTTEVTSTVEETEQKIAKYDITDPSAFVGYLEKEAGAVKTDSDSIYLDQLRKGVYIENDKDTTIGNIVVQDFRLSGPLANHWKFLSSIPEFYWAKGSASFRGVKDYDLKNSVCYFRCFLDSEDLGVFTGTYNGKDYSVNTYDSTLSATCVSYYVFSKEENALECFKTIVNKVFEEKKTEVYSNLVNTISGMTFKELYDGIYTSKTISGYPLMISPTTMNQDAKIITRKFVNLEELPSIVYELDEGKNIGHLTYNCTGKWCELNDIWKATDVEPDYIIVKEESKHVSIELNGNVLVIMASLDGYKQDGCPNIYYDEWPVANFSDNKTICSVSSDFGLHDPYKVEFNTDQNDQFFYLSRKAGGGGTLVCSELYKRRK